MHPGDSLTVQLYITSSRRTVRLGSLQGVYSMIVTLSRGLWIEPVYPEAFQRLDVCHGNLELARKLQTSGCEEHVFLKTSFMHFLFPINIIFLDSLFCSSVSSYFIFCALETIIYIYYLYIISVVKFEYSKTNLIVVICFYILSHFSSISVKAPKCTPC